MPPNLKHIDEMTSCPRLLLCVAALFLGADGFHAPARRAAARPASRRRPGVAAPARPPRRTGPLAFYQGGVLGVGTPEVLVVAAVGYFLLGPEELFKLSKEIGKVVAQVRTYVTDSAAEWQSTFNDELDFKEVKEIQAAAQELQEAFNFRSSRYQNDYSNFNSGADETYDPLSEPPASPMLDVDDWNAKILADEAAAAPAAASQASAVAAEASAAATAVAAPPAAATSTKAARLAEVERLYEAKRRALELEFGYERDKLAIELEDDDA